MKEFLKKVLKRSGVGFAVYTFIHKIYRKFKGPRDIRRLHRHGYGALARFDKVMSDNGIVYYCEAGTLLGIVRDNGFIKHDDDIDVAIMPETQDARFVLDALLRAGFQVVHGFRYADRTTEFTVRDRSGVTIDVFFHRYASECHDYVHQIFMRWYPDRTYPSVMANIALQFKFVAPKGVKRVVVHGVQTNIPINAEEVLDSEYGPWRKPDPNFKSDSLKYKELPGYSYRMLSAAGL